MSITLTEQISWVREQYADTAFGEQRRRALTELHEIIAARHRADDEEPGRPELEPAQSPSVPGRTYENPNDGEEYTPPEEDPKAVAGGAEDLDDDEDQVADEDDEDDDEDLVADEDDEEL